LLYIRNAPFNGTYIGPINSDYDDDDDDGDGDDNDGDDDDVV
jgi:hypothetical protein